MTDKRTTAAQRREQLAAIGRGGDMAYRVKSGLFAAVLCDAGMPSLGHVVADMEPHHRTVDAFAWEALLRLADAEDGEPAQVFTAAMGLLPPEFVDPYPEGQAIVSLESRERPMTAEEVAAKGPRGAFAGTIISMGFPALLVLATVKNPLQFAERVAHLLTEDTKGRK